MHDANLARLERWKPKKIIGGCKGCGFEDAHEDEPSFCCDCGITERFLPPLPIKEMGLSAQDFKGDLGYFGLPLNFATALATVGYLQRVFFLKESPAVEVAMIILHMHEVRC